MRLAVDKEGHDDGDHQTHDDGDDNAHVQSHIVGARGRWRGHREVVSGFYTQQKRQKTDQTHVTTGSVSCGASSLCNLIICLDGRRETQKSFIK